MKSILNIGPCFTKGSVRAGGIVVLFENWAEYCNGRYKCSAVVDNNKSNYPSMFAALFSIIRQTWKQSKGKDLVMIHGTKNDYQWLVPILVWIAKTHNCKVALRKFAGNFWAYYEKQTGLRRRLIDYEINASDIIYWETHFQVAFFSNLFPHKQSNWFTNVRDKMPALRDSAASYKRKYVFLSRVERQKGIGYLLAAFDQLGSDYMLDIYGPTFGYSESDFAGHNCNYCGPVDSTKVNEVLVQYDCLLLPTCWRTEGYPGIIMEAYNAGIPVIATNVGGIPELIQEGENGFLINPESADEIINAVQRLESCNFSVLCNNAANSFEKYDAEKVNAKIYSELSQL